MRIQQWNQPTTWALTAVCAVLLTSFAAQAVPICNGGEIIRHGTEIVGCRFSTWGSAEQSMCNGATTFAPTTGGTCHVCVTPEFASIVPTRARWPELSISGAPADFSCLGGYCALTPTQARALYPLDEATGSTVSDLIGRNPGTRINGPTSVTGKVGLALHFDGVNDYVEVPSVAANNVGTGDFSIAAWIRTTASGIQMIVDKRYEYSSVKGYGFYLHSTGQLGFQLADGTSWTSYGAPTALANGQWHLVAVTVDRDDPFGGTFWADGVAVGTFDPTVRATSLDNTAPFRIGSRSSAVTGIFNGDIDEVELVGRVLTATEIGQLYQAGSQGRCRPQCMPRPANMTAWYALDEGSGSTANDLAYGNTAAHINGPVPVTGKVASALHFDGANDYLEAPSTSFNNVGTGDFSIDAWIRTSSTGTQMIVDKRREGASVIGYGFYLYSTGQLGFQLADGTSWTGYGAPTALADGQWHLVAVTVDRDNPNGGTFWADGVPVGTFNPTVRATSLDNTMPFRIGSRSTYVSGIFNGDIDEVELFNRVLTASEISQLYQAGIAGKCK